MKLAKALEVAAAIALALFTGCLQTKSEVDVKPVDINLNITGRLELVITDARRQEEEITGSKPKRIVTPQDIGLPAAPAPQSNATGMGTMLTDDGPASARLVLVADTSTDEQALIQRMTARHPQIASMLDSQSAGESHTGFLVPKSNLSPSQQALINAENADRAELYKLEGVRKNASVDQVALGYYMARLEHVNKGTWVERYNKSYGSWECFQWKR
jgi:uncharacterized protein YdbL (DUF1318 family)